MCNRGFKQTNAHTHTDWTTGRFTPLHGEKNTVLYHASSFGFIPYNSHGIMP